jgi:uncharacterized protein (DUF1499 family)
LPALNWILLAAAIMLVAAATLFIAGERTWTVFAGPADQGPVDFTTLQLRTSPNQYLVCPPGTCTARADQAAPVFAVSEQRLRETLITSWAAMPRTRQVAGTADPASGEIRFVQTTALLHYPDTISVHTWPAGDGRSTLAIYSRSLVGRSDLGANGERVRAWLADLPLTPTD